MSLLGLHHITAITATAQANVDFYSGTLGMRLVKRTVNQDDVSAYHLFYGDRQGSPGTELTFFEWRHIRPAVRGSHTISRIWLRVPLGSLGAWRERLAERVDDQGPVSWGERSALALLDDEGQRVVLVEDDDGAGTEPWEPGTVDSASAVRGLHGVSVTVRDAEQLDLVLTRVLGFDDLGERPSDPGTTVRAYGLGGGGPGRELYVEEWPDGPRGRYGAGGVHHLALRVADDAAQLEWRERIAAVGLHVTEQIDRFYFRSIYFPVPGGVLFEIATDGPGFATDEPLETLGEELSLPPFLEAHRTQIERGLVPLDLPAARTL